MSRTTFLLLLDRIPRYSSLLGLLGLVGVAGVIDPEWYRFSALSFLSYLSFFRFFRRFADPAYGPTAQSVPFLVVALLVAAVGPLLLSIWPGFGFVGFAGWCGLYDTTRSAPRVPVA
jgi:hypothetical protein